MEAEKAPSLWTNASDIPASTQCCIAIGIPMRMAEEEEPVRAPTMLIERIRTKNGATFRLKM